MRDLMKKFFVFIFVVGFFIIFVSVLSANDSKRNSPQPIAVPTRSETVQSNAHPENVPGSTLRISIPQIGLNSTFFAGFFCGVVVTAFLFSIILIIKRREEKIKRTIEEEKELRKKEIRSRINKKMDDLVSRYDETASEIHKSRLKAEQLLLRKSNNS